MPRNPAPLGRRAAAEAVGTGLLVTVVVGSGIAAQTLSPNDVGLQLLENALATAAGLAVLILVFGPVSGAHLNPVVSLADWWLGRRAGAGLRPRELAAYLPAQVLGGAAGTVLADALFGRALLAWSGTTRGAPRLLLSEVVATAGLLLLVFALARSGRATAAPAAVGGYIGAAYFFTSSTSYANPAVTVARSLTDTFAGIAPASVPGFVLAQLVGLGVGLAAIQAFYPDAARSADEVVVPPLRAPESGSLSPRPPAVR